MAHMTARTATRRWMISEKTASCCAGDQYGCAAVGGNGLALVVFCGLACHLREDP